MNKKLRVGLIGTGSVVREIYQHLYFSSAYSEMLSVEAICDSNAQNLNEFGDRYHIPAARRFSDYRELCAKVPLDAVAVNTPDSFHKPPVLCALEAGLDVFVPKPLADTTADAAAMIAKLAETGRFMGVDFHKREDPRIKEAKARFQHGDYGTFQSTTWYMLDKLLVADPNHTPRFFASGDFASKNTPVSFLTVHMVDAFMTITELKPVEVRATGYKQKLPSLRPIAVDGYDLVDTEVLFENGGVGHFITGWALPNTAHAPTVQSGRIIGSVGMLDLDLDKPGYHELLPDGIFERNPLFRNFEIDGSVDGYGMRCPGRIFQNIRRFREGGFTAEQRTQLLSPFNLGFYTTAVCEAAHDSLAQAKPNPAQPGVVRGAAVSVTALVQRHLGGKTL